MDRGNWFSLFVDTPCVNCAFCCQLYQIKEEEIIRLHTEAAKLGKMREQYVQKLTQMEKRCASLEQEIKKLDRVIAHLQKDLNITKKCAESGKKAVHDLQRDRKVLKRKILKVSGMLLW